VIRLADGEVVSDEERAPFVSLAARGT